MSACNTGLTVVDLPVGGVSVLSSTATKGCIKIPAATSAPADYLVIASNTNATPDVLGDFIFKSDEGETVPADESFPQQFGGLGAQRCSAGDEHRSGRNADQVRDPFSRDGAAPAAAAGCAARLQGAECRAPDAAVSKRQAIPAVGDQTTFKVPGQTNACTNFTTVTAAVTYINDKVIIYNDVTSPSNGFTATDYQQIGDEFSSLIYPTDVSYFGTPLDQDNNGRIIIVYTPQVNKLTPANNASFVGGFFFAGDLFPSTPPTPGAFACAQSNMAEMFYVLAPDPDGTINSNKRSTATVRQGTRGTIAHEFQHMINASGRIRVPSYRISGGYMLDEALAHFAEDRLSRPLAAGECGAGAGGQRYGRDLAEVSWSGRSRHRPPLARTRSRSAEGSEHDRPVRSNDRSRMAKTI